MHDERNQPDTSHAGDALSRRDVMLLSAAAWVATGAGSGNAAGASPTPTQRSVDIKTPDGSCDAVLLSIVGARAPAVILYPDALGLRPVMVDMGTRLVGQGYTVLVINPFYRNRHAPVFGPTFDYGNPSDRADLTKLREPLTHEAVTRDAHSLVAFLDAQPEVRSDKPIGAIGFCMGGSMTVRAAAVEPKRVGACVSFHGGQLVTDDPASPHKLIPSSQASYHFAVAAGDDDKEPNAKAVLAETLKTAKRPGTVEVYPGTKHGWMVPDSAIYDQAHAERGWAAMTALFKDALV
jgi:carboxymethylenebutenolidase